MTDALSRAGELADQLARSGDLTPEWEPIFRATPRHLFIPATIWTNPPDRPGLTPLHHDDDPRAWLDRAYDLAPVVTQVDDGEPDSATGHGRRITSSASHPAVVAHMLAALHLEPGQRVLEIGTGTGYNAALLSRRTGAHNVVTIENNPTTAATARHNLHTQQLHPTVITGDGTRGYPPHAPYHRIIATAATQRIPYAWVEQTTPGGLIISPWGNRYYNGALVALTVHPDHTATGHVIGNAAFMFLRDQRTPVAIDTDDHDDTTADTGTTPLTPYDVAGDPNAAFAISNHTTDIGFIYRPPTTDNDPHTVWFTTPDQQSWARLDTHEHHNHSTYHQHGPRHLWTEIEQAHQQWTENGQPTRENWTIHIEPTGQHVTLTK